MANALDLSLGAIVVSSWFSFLAMGIVIVVAYRYFADYPRDPAIFKLLVILNLVLSVTDTVVGGVWVYDWAVTNYAKPQAMAALHIASVIENFCIGVCSLSVQSFYAYRLWLISMRKNWWIPAAIICMSLAQFGMILWLVYHWSQPAERMFTALPDVLPNAYVWLAGSMGADFLITSGIVYYLRVKVKARQQEFISSRSMVISSPNRATAFNKIISRAVQANALSLICQCLVFILFKSNIGLYFFLIDFNLVKVYTFSLLCSLCGRKPNSTSFSSNNDQTEGAMSLGTLPRSVEVRVTQDKFHDSQRTIGSQPQKIRGNHDPSLDDLSQ